MPPARPAPRRWPPPCRRCRRWPRSPPRRPLPRRTGERALLRLPTCRCRRRGKRDGRDADKPVNGPSEVHVRPWLVLSIGKRSSSAAGIALGQIAENPFDRRRVHRLGVLIRPGDEAGNGLIARRPWIRLAEQRRLVLGRRRDLMVLVGSDGEAMAEVQRRNSGGIGRCQPRRAGRDRPWSRPGKRFRKGWPPSARVRQQPSWQPARHGGRESRPGSMFHCLLLVSRASATGAIAQRAGPALERNIYDGPQVLIRHADGGDVRSIAHHVRALWSTGRDEG